MKTKDKKLAEVINKIGYLSRPVNHDLFSSIINHIVGQQISSKAQQTIWMKMLKELGKIDADTLISTKREKIQSFGLTFKKVDYILEFAKKVKDKEIDLSEYPNKSDEEIIKELTSLNGIGVWTAEMVLLHVLSVPIYLTIMI